MAHIAFEIWSHPREEHWRQGIFIIVRFFQESQAGSSKDELLRVRKNSCKHSHEQYGPRTGPDPGFRGRGVQNGTRTIRTLDNSDLFVMVNSDLIKYFFLVNSDLFHWSIRTLSVVNSDLFHWSIRTLPVVNSENFYWSVRTLLVVDSINLVKPNQSLCKIFPWNNNEMPK